MAIYKSVKGVGKTKSSLYNVMEYVAKEREGEKVKATGINCSSDYREAFKDMMNTKEIHDNVEGRQYRHHIQSFKHGEVDEAKAHEIGVEFAREHFKGFEVLVTTHKDKEHIHNHFIINTVNMENGRKLRELYKVEYEQKLKQGKEFEKHELYLKDLMEKNNEICRKYGLSEIDLTKRKSISRFNKKEYMAFEKHKQGKEGSYKIELAKEVKRLMKQVKSKEEFEQEFKKRGIEVVWKENIKNVTFKFTDEKKKSIRLENLRKTFNVEEFTKDGLLKQFEKNLEQEQQLKDLTKALREREKEKETVQAGAGRSAEEIIEKYRQKEQEQKKQEKAREKEKYRGIGR